jgi:deoxyinosine 3'endonuclease (endonuclease V)
VKDTPQFTPKPEKISKTGVAKKRLHGKSSAKSKAREKVVAAVYERARAKGWVG